MPRRLKGQVSLTEGHPLGQSGGTEGNCHISEHTALRSCQTLGKITKLPLCGSRAHWVKEAINWPSIV